MCQMVGHYLFLKLLIYLWESEKEKKSEQEQHRELSSSWFTHQMLTTAGTGARPETENKALKPELPHKPQVHNHLSAHLPPPRVCTSRKWCQERSMLTGDAGVPGGILTTTPNTCPPTYYLSIQAFSWSIAEFCVSMNYVISKGFYAETLNFNILYYTLHKIGNNGTASSMNIFKNFILSNLVLHGKPIAL